MVTAAPRHAQATEIEVGTLNSRIAYATPTELGPLLIVGRYWYPEAATEKRSEPHSRKLPSLPVVTVPMPS